MQNKTLNEAEVRRNSGICVTAVALFLLPVHVVYPHDIWLLPEQFILSKGDVIIVHQLAGSELDVEVELPVLRTMTPSFSLITSGGSVDLLSELPDIRTQPEVKPVLQRKVDIEGLVLLTMEHAFIHTEFPNEKFSEYLEHEGAETKKFHDHIERRSSQRERYARTLKSLIHVGETAEGDLYKQAIGQKLEILLLQNPYLMEPGDSLQVQILFEGKTLTDKRVTALHGDGKQLVSMSTMHTNSEGIAEFTLDRAGFWLIRLVHILPCSERYEQGDCSYVDWESYWTSYSFQLD